VNANSDVFHNRLRFTCSCGVEGIMSDKKKKAKKLKAYFKLWLSSEDAEGVFGDGKWRLLQAIDAKGSLSLASDALRISYRKAWGDLKKAEKQLNVRLVQRQRGGKGGGETILTENGKKWVKAFSLFRRDIEKTVDDSYAKHIRRLVQ
jgi:molybdate transport system regulatory protein